MITSAQAHANRIDRCGVALGLELKRLIRESTDHPARPAHPHSSIAIEGTITGNHGGKRYLLRRVNEDWLSHYEHIPAARQGSPLWAFDVLGEELARFLGYERISNELMLVPDAAELNGAFEILDQELRQAGKPGVIARFTVEEKNFNESEYFNSVSKRIAPYGKQGNMLLHDASYHGPAVAIPDLFYEHFEAQAHYWNLFVEHVRKKLPNPKLEQVLARDLNPAPTSGGERPFFAYGTRKLGENFDRGTGNTVVDLSRILRSGTRTLDAEWYDATFGKLTSKGAPPRDLLKDFVQEQMKVDLGSNDALLKAYEEFSVLHSADPAFSSSRVRELSPEQAIEATRKRIQELDDARHAYEKRPGIARDTSDPRSPWILTREILDLHFAGESVVWRNNGHDEKVRILKWNSATKTASVERPFYWNKFLKELPKGVTLQVNAAEGHSWTVWIDSSALEPVVRHTMTNKEFSLKEAFPEGSTVLVVEKGSSEPVRKILPKRTKSTLFSHYEIRQANDGALESFPTRHLRAKDFAKRYPHPIADLSQPQTRVRYHGRDFLIESYDEKSGNVTISHDEIVTFSLDSSPEAKLRRGMRRYRKELKLGGYQPGDIIAIDGNTFQVIHTTTPRAGHMALRRRARVILPWRQFSLLAESPELVTSKPWDPLPAPKTGKRGLLKTLLKPWTREIAPLLGRARVKRISTEDTTIVRYELGTEPKASVVEIQIPKEETLRLESRLAQIEKLLAATPLQLEEPTKRIVVQSNLKASDSSTLASALVRTRELTAPTIKLYPPGLKQAPKDLRWTYWHELGHQLSGKIFGSAMPEQHWIRAMIEDGMTFYQDYSASTPAEDFADMIATYLKSDGGRFDPGLRKSFPNRYKLMDRIFGIPAVQAEASVRMRRTASRYGVIVLVSAATGAGIGSVYLAAVLDDDEAVKKPSSPAAKQ